MKKGAHAHHVSFRRLYVIAREILRADPSIDNLEWSERIKDTLIRAKLGYPERLEAIHDAMRAVEGVIPRAAPSFPVAKQEVPRPLPEQPTPEGLARRDAILAALRTWIVKTEWVDTPPSDTTAQIEAYRRAEGATRRAYRRTAKGWVKP